MLYIKSGDNNPRKRKNPYKWPSYLHPRTSLLKWVGKLIQTFQVILNQKTHNSHMESTREQMVNQVSLLYFSCLFISKENKGKNIGLDLTMFFFKF
jgi:hypothetical protein